MKSVLVIGMGRFGRHLAKKMADLGNDVVIVDRDEEVIDRYANVFTDAQVGDCTNVNVIRALGVNHYDVCFVAIGEDFQSSLVVTSLLKELGEIRRLQGEAGYSSRPAEKDRRGRGGLSRERSCGEACNPP